MTRDTKTEIKSVAECIAARSDTTTDTAYGRSNASAALRDGPLAWLGELDLIDADDRGPQPFVSAAMVEIRAAMLELELAGAWFDPKRHVLCFPSLSAPDDWGLMYLGSDPDNTCWREVVIGVDRW